MSDDPVIVSLEWDGKRYASIQDVWAARDDSPWVQIVGYELSGPIIRHWSDGKKDTVCRPRCIPVGDWQPKEEETA